MKRISLVGAGLAFGLIALSGCGSGGSTGGGPPLPASASVSRPVHPSVPSRSSKASQAARLLVRRYFSVLDEVRQHPRGPLTALTRVAASTQLTAERHLVSAERSKGLRQTGDTIVKTLEVQAVTLNDSDPSAGKVPTVTIDACWDVSKVDVIDRKGRSVVEPDRADRGWTRYTVANYHWSENPSAGWRIATGQDLKKAPCAAS